MPERVCKIIDQAIQMHGALGVSQHTPLAEMYASHAPCEWPTDPMRSITWLSAAMRCACARAVNMIPIRPRCSVISGDFAVE